MQLAGQGNTFDSGDVTPCALNGQRQAAVHPLSIHEHRAGSAGAFVAAFLGTREVQAIAQIVEERHTRLQLRVYLSTVDPELHAMGCFAVGGTDVQLVLLAQAQLRRAEIRVRVSIIVPTSARGSSDNQRR